ncbi:phage portal protein [Sphingopyxis sp. J-6]|uniref:phage portal protein n=1 Tax=Sphingopyxis sp. J-6 TaxID=3122054 RepID=UPI00398406B9
MASDAPLPVRPRASSDGGVIISTAAEMDAWVRSQDGGGSVNDAMKVAAIFACVRIICGSVSTLPFQVKRRVDERTRADASDHGLNAVINRRPNRWQKPAQFKSMMQAHVLLRGNAYAAITRGVGGRVIALTPLHPDRMQVKQREDLTIEYIWTRKNGGQVTFAQNEVMHLFGLTLDGVKGVSPITYARETIEEARAMAGHGRAMFKNGASVSGALQMPKGSSLTEEQVERLRANMDEYRQGGAREGRVIILEDGLEFKQMALSSEDAQWIDGRKFSRSDIAMFFGMPPHMIGDTEKSTSWGTGIVEQTQGYRAFTLEPHLVMWEEGVNGDCLDPDRRRDDVGIYVRFNRNAIVRSDINKRWEAYQKGLQWGVYSPNKVLEMEDENPRPDGDIYYPPPNMTADSEGKKDVSA